MSSETSSWEVRVPKGARKHVDRAPRPERERLAEALAQIAADPLSGDVVRLTNERAAFRRRVGDWRIFFDLIPTHRVVEVVAIERRTTTTYRKRR